MCTKAVHLKLVTDLFTERFIQALRSKEHHETVASKSTKDEIQWHFNSSSAPHFGGLLCKCEQVLIFEDMNTLLEQVEACLNSRPLTAISDDPNDLEPIAPGHFLTGASLHQLPDRDFSSVPINRLSQYQVTQKKLQELWNRKQREYLSQLQVIPVSSRRAGMSANGKINRCTPRVKQERAKMCDEIHDGNLVTIDNSATPRGLAFEKLKQPTG
ncbi:uncharacterized protein LOC134209739 [Armigeres subalbatus]|uniref:uncharacterized protein LOC134209739 n=1 Tax=Armigeres subalbatus TaxID=124917 RepID=UPI002ED4AC41